MLRLFGSAALAIALLLPAAVRADGYYIPAAPAVSYYAPAPAVSYYTPAPAVSYYTPAPTVSYYTPAVSYYAAPVSYYTPAPAVSYYAAPVAYYAPAYYPSVSTYNYGLFGRRAVTTVNYGYGASSYYYSPRVYRAYYGPGFYR